MEIIGFWSPRHSLNFDGLYSVACLMMILVFYYFSSQVTLQESCTRSPKGPYKSSTIIIRKITSTLVSFLAPSQRYQLPSGTIYKSLNNPPQKSSKKFPATATPKNQKKTLSPIIIFLVKTLTKK
jgi:hypothetical protein